jgi:membrane fusion protein, copper/silver efflux system
MNTIPFKTIRTAIMPLLVLLLVALTAVPTASAKQLYTCSMHPEIIRDAPGNCPICGMTLVPLEEDRAPNEAAPSDKAVTGSAPAATPAPAPDAPRKVKYYKSTMMPGEVSPTPAKDSMGMDMVPVYEDEEPAKDATGAPTTMLRLDSGTVQRMNLKTAAVESGPVEREVHTFGEVAFNERTRRTVTTKYDGWVERLYVNAAWTDVKPGDPLFEIYSPELYGASLNYITAYRSDGANAGPITRAATERLRLYDVPADYIAALAKLDKPPRMFVVRAQTAGTVVAKNIVEGQMLKAGEAAFDLADLSSVWVLAQIYENDLPFVAKGVAAEVKTASSKDRAHRGAVSLVEPVVTDATRTNVVRIVLDNRDGGLRPGMYVDVRIAARLKDSAVLVPDSAVLRSGERNTVFVARGDGRYEPREIKLGARTANNRYEVTSGLKAGETVVTSGQFMLDSESQLREAIQKMLAANK